MLSPLTNVLMQDSGFSGVSFRLLACHVKCLGERPLTFVDAFIQLVIRARLCKLHYTCGREGHRDLFKHDRSYLLDAFDGLNTREEWKIIRIADFPLRRQPVIHRRCRRHEVNMDEDSDGSVGEEYSDTGEDIDGTVDGVGGDQGMGEDQDDEVDGFEADV